MKKAVILLSLILAGCSVEADDNRKTLTKTQRAEIAERVSQFGVVNVSAEPTDFSGPASAYLVQGQAVQVAMVEELPGKAKYTACGACHGAQGQGGVGPMLAGKTADYIVGRLRSYKAGETVGAQSALMWGQAAMLSEDDIAKLAEYVSSL